MIYKPQTEYLINEKNEMVPSTILRQENFEADFKKLITSLKIPNAEIQNQCIEEENISNNGKYDYRDFYTNKTKEFVKVQFERDINEFNYSY